MAISLPAIHCRTLLLEIHGTIRIRQGPHPPAARRFVPCFEDVVIRDLDVIGSVEAALLCAVGKSLWAEMDSAGMIPAPIKLGTRCIWPVAELRGWMAAGCPCREKWETLRREGAAR